MGLAIPWNTLCKNIVPKLGLGVCWINSGGGGLHWQYGGLREEPPVMTLRHGEELRRGGKLIACTVSIGRAVSSSASAPP